MNQPVSKWLRFSVFNLMLVALLGSVLRYKIAFSLPIIDQKFLLQAHSHFAFAGWITQSLMTLLVNYLQNRGNEAAFQRYRWILWANVITAYGMLITFPFEGYAFLSIMFSTLSIFASYVFAFMYWRDLSRLPSRNVSHSWFKSALIFNVISSAGPFFLAYMLAARHIHPNPYLASVYFFLHFQYNGWFFFACMGLFSFELLKNGIEEKNLKQIFRLFVTACVPAYLLSALWLPIPGWIYVIVVLAVICQISGWIILLRLIRGKLSVLKPTVSTLPRRLLVLCAVALSIKLLLQAVSVIPSLSKLAFGFRPIVIGYLHLVLLGVISLFLIIYLIHFQLITINKSTIRGFIVFIVGIIINEVLLMIQGVGDLVYVETPFINVYLFIAALILFSGTIIFNSGQLRMRGKWDQELDRPTASLSHE
ncbi:MAG: hypothetical protein C5B59_19940 [Bacteroidetes bacterium]|nr:MAG: hypothetical protein C5B59_19940 [Bacteroidota bacterium]